MLTTKSFSVVYVNGVLTQKAYIYPENDEIVYEKNSEVEKENLESLRTADVTTYKYSDFITEGDEKNPEDDLVNINAQRSWDSSGWFYLQYFAPSPILSCSKPCDLYFQNYDDNPDDNRYMESVITLSAGTPIAIAAGLVIGYIAGGVAAITVSFILQLLGASIIADVIYNYCYGQVCFSTQKILYAPIVEGNNVFPDAYITKRWLVTADYLHNTYNVKLSNASYASNRGQTPESIAFNAQVATM